MVNIDNMSLRGLELSAMRLSGVGVNLPPFQCPISISVSISYSSLCQLLLQPAAGIAIVAVTFLRTILIYPGILKWSYLASGRPIS